MRAARWNALLFGTIAVGGAGLAFEPAFSGTRWWIAIAGATVFSTLLAAWSRSNDIATARFVLASAAGFAILTFTVVLGGTFGDSVGTTTRELLGGVMKGWSDALRDELPLVRPTRPLVWATAVTWITAAVVGRSTAVGWISVPAMIAPATLLGLATAVTVPAGGPSAIPMVFVAVGVLGVTAVTSTREIEWTWRRGRESALVVAAAVLLGLLATVAYPDDRDAAFDPRSFRDEQLSTEDVPDLLSGIDERLGDDATDAIEVQVLDGVTPERLRLVVYDSYDGQRWTTSTSYGEIDAIPASELLPTGELTSLRLSILDREGPWLPLTDRVLDVSPLPRAWDDATTTALAGPSRSLLMRGTAIQRSDIATVTDAATDLDPNLLALPGSTPASIIEWAESVVEPDSDARAAVSALEAAVAAIGRDDTVPGGHSLGRLATTLSNESPASVEQLVALHAVLTRAVGVPSRIVVGYRVPEEGPITSHDLTAWTEVPFVGIGWIPFDPVPAEQTVGDETVPDPGATTTTTVAEQAVTEAEAIPRQLDPGERTADDITASSNRGIGWPLLLAVLLGVAVLVVVAIALARLVRRRNRHRAPTSPARIAGAWGEMLDRLRETAGTGPDSRSVEEAMGQIEELVPDLRPDVRAFTDLVNAALYSDRPPDPDDADEAWRLLGHIERALTEVRGHGVRLRATLDPRSLRYPTPRPAPQRARRPHPSRRRRTDHPRVQR
ncbi:MAG: transglutaminase-like domain-containing protein [Acidimicrobiales bacterium]